MSRAAHRIAVNGMAVEEHEQSGSQLKGIVFGGLDGILTSFAIIAGSVGANLSPVAMLALGVSNVLADALSMGVGEFLSSRSYNAYVTKEREREEWELQNYPAGEIEEMVELFVARGMSREDAELVIQRMAKYKDFFVDLMMTEELALPVPSDTGAMDAFKDGLTMFCAFAFFGMLPLVGFVVAGMVYPSVSSEGCAASASASASASSSSSSRAYLSRVRRHTLTWHQHPLVFSRPWLPLLSSARSLFAIACCVTGVCLLGLGAFKAKFHDKQYVRSGIETLLLGGACAAVAYFVGQAVAQFTESKALFAVPPTDATLLVSEAGPR